MDLQQPTALAIAMEALAFRLQDISKRQIQDTAIQTVALLVQMGFIIAWLQENPAGNPEGLVSRQMNMNAELPAQQQQSATTNAQALTHGQCHKHARTLMAYAGARHAICLQAADYHQYLTTMLAKVAEQLQICVAA
jgi:hypothetical protein